MSSAPRLPDFICVGTMKAGTTTLFAWLDSHPDTAMPEVKEPAFFSRDDRWAEGVDAYARHFAHAPLDKLTGEASVNYTRPENPEVTAARIKQVVPDARLFAVVRDPVDRLRSHYRHRRQRGIEKLPLAEAVRAPDNTYVGRSLYEHCLGPYFDLFPDFLVARTEQLDSGEAWNAILDHVGLRRIPVPEVHENVTDELVQMRGVTGRVLQGRRKRLAQAMPPFVRRLGMKVLSSAEPPEVRRAESSAPLPPDVVALLRDDAERFVARLGWEDVGWRTLRAES